MSSVAEASELVRRIASPAQVGDTIKRQIDRAARRIPFWSYSRTKDAWYADARMRIDADEIQRLRDLALGSAEARAARDEYRELQDRIARLEAALRISDPEFHGAQADALRIVSGAENRTLD